MSRYVLAAFCLVLAALVAHNVVWAVRNQTGNDCGYTVCIGPRTVSSMALRNRHPVVKGRVAVFFALRTGLAGETLVAPAWLRPWKWELQNISRVTVVSRGREFAVAPHRVGHLTRRATSRHTWLVKRKGRRGTWRQLNLLVTDGDSPYIVAETGEPLGPMFIMRESHYTEVAGRGAVPR